MKSQINKYPNTLFKLTKQSGILSQITEELKKIKYLYRNEPTFKLLFETKSEEQLTKYSNIIGVPAIIIIVGLIRLIYRKISTQRTYKRDD